MRDIKKRQKAWRLTSHISGWGNSNIVGLLYNSRVSDCWEVSSAEKMKQKNKVRSLCKTAHWNAYHMAYNLNVENKTKNVLEENVDEHLHTLGNTIFYQK